MADKPSKQSKVSRCMRILGKARSVYVRFMYSCADMAGHGDNRGVPSSFLSSPPTRNSSSRTTKDLQDLIKANAKCNKVKIVGSKIDVGSKSELVKKVEMEILQRRQQRHCHQAMDTIVQKKSSEVIETIDEDSPSDFSGDLKQRDDFLLQPVSRSSPVRKRIGVMV